MKTRQAVIKYAEEEYAINIKHKEQPYTIKTDSKQNNKKKTKQNARKHHRHQISV